MNLRAYLPIAIVVLFYVPVAAQEGWPRHVIDNTLRGADGVRLADFNKDGLQDVVTGWEESGVVRLYLNPGTDQVRDKWPAVTVGKSPSPEDAVPFDIDGDGRLEVVSCHEGKSRRVIVHRNEAEDWLATDGWSSSRFEQIDGQMWMFAEPIQIHGDRQALIVGSKGNQASITLLTAPTTNASDLQSWTAHRLRDAGWIMTLKSIDMDGDGDEDLVYSDRKGRKRAVGWLEQPDSHQDDWHDHVLGATDVEPMFIDVTASRILVSTRNAIFVELKRKTGKPWRESTHPNPENVSFGKAIKRLSDGSIVMSSNTDADKKAKPKQPGMWIQSVLKDWSVVDPTPAVKLDRLEAIDLDGDGDEDLMTCEERKNLGVIWYENPSR